MTASSMRASTSVPTEVWIAIPLVIIDKADHTSQILWNESEKLEETHMAHIEFLSMDDWMKEVNECLITIEEDLEAAHKITIETSASYAKLCLVYPSIDVLELDKHERLAILKAIDLSPYLGKTQIITERRVTEFRKRVSKFIDASNLSEAEEQPTCMSPLIRVVRVYLKAKILNAGLVFVDLPGFGDSNAARNAVAQGYVHKADHVFVISRIVRAVTDGAARELLGGNFQKRLVLTKKYNGSFVSFIATCTDDITVEETVQSLQQGHKSSTEYKEVLSERSALAQRIEDLNEQQFASKKRGKEISKNLKVLKASKKRKRESENPDDADSPIIKSEVNGDQTSIESYKELQKLNKAENIAFDIEFAQLNRNNARIKIALRGACIRERNLYTQRRLRLDFEAGLQNTRRDLKEAGENDIKVEQSEGIISPGVAVVEAELRVFCVSSKAFQKINGRLKWDQSIEGFPNPKSTGIPELQDFAYELSTSRSDGVYEKVLGDLDLLKESAQRFVKGMVKGPDLKAFRKTNPAQRAEVFLNKLTQVS